MYERFSLTDSMNLIRSLSNFSTSSVQFCDEIRSVQLLDADIGNATAAANISTYNKHMYISTSSNVNTQTCFCFVYIHIISDNVNENALKRLCVINNTKHLFEALTVYL